MAMQVKFPFGRTVSVLVTHVEGASGDFFVQISDEAGKLDALMAEIEENVLSGRARPPNASEIMVGCIYLAQYQEDSQWYRGRVLRVNPAEQRCEVFFVDYGNTDFVPLSCIRIAEEKFCDLPPQSFECELDGVDRFRGGSFEESVALLNETILEQELYCKAVQLKKQNILVTQLFFDEKGTKSVLDEMRNGGQTTPAAVPLTNGDSTIPRQPNLKREVKYETISLSPDSFHDLSVTWVEDPSHFWCQLLRNTDIIEELMDNLAEVYTNLDPAALPLQSCTVGYPCCAKFYEDDTWYRGIITNVSSIATGQIEVRFVDYGNAQETELSDVKDLKDGFLKIPCQALNFAIAGVEPASKDGLWADEAKILFEKLIKFKHVVGLVTSVQNDGKHRVKLIDTTSDLDMELNQILIAANFGIKSTDTPPATTLTATTPTLKSSPPTMKPSSRPVFAKENVPVGLEEKVLVTNIINPSKFYCQLFKNGPKLEGLMQDIGRHYSKLGANEELLSSPSSGDPCCAQFSEDGCWYRAVVLSTPPQGVTVQYVDYGNSETLPLNKIKKLIPKFSDLPQQGIECTLNRIKPKFQSGEPKWRPRDTEKFMDLALEKEGMLTAVTQDSRGVCRVELVVKNRKDDQNISEQLVISGNAELADGALPASENWNNLKSQTIPDPDLKVGHFEDVIVSYIEHPCNFWCQLQKSAAQLESLMAEISELYSSGGQRNSISNPVCGMLCCGQFTEDNKWYRGKITGVEKGGLVEVHFVDFGNYEKLPLARVKKLQTEFLKLPTQAIKCALTKISPCHQDLLSDDVMNRFEELTLDKELVMMADKYDEVSGSFVVVLLDTTEGKNLDIGSDLQTIMAPCTTREEARIIAAQVQPGTKERVFVSSASSPSKFFCQLLKSSDSLDELMNEMFEYYENLTAQQEEMSKPSVGEFCAAKFTLDDGWYRAKVIDVQGSNISVLYIDYGNSETVSLSRLKVLNSKFHSLAGQAIECSLSGNVRELSDNTFLELVSEKEFTARILTVKSLVAEVDLVSKDTNQSVSSILANASPTSTSSRITQVEWKPGDAVDVFIPFAESTQKFFCHASAHSAELDELMNRLEESYSSSVENVSTLKVGSLCVAWYDAWYRAKVELVQGKDVTVNFIDYGDTATISLDNVRTIKPEFFSLPAQAIQCCLKGFMANPGPEHFRELVAEQEFKAQVISAKSGGVYEVDLVPADGSASLSQTLSKELQPSVSQSLSVAYIQLKHGDKVDVFIPFVDSAQKFFCQLSQNSSDLDDLMIRLEEHYSSDQENITSISVGSFCVARYEDGGWYRAQITQVQGNSIEVFYIDYGDAATIPLSNVRSLTPEFSSLPAQAVNCCLKGFSSNQGPENFKDLVIEMEFKAQVTGVKSQNTYEVELLSQDGTSIFTSKTLSSEMETAEHTSSVGIIQLKPGDKVDVFIPFVDSAQKFFCQLSQNSSDLDDLMIRLEEHYSSDQESVTSISVGSFCVARYEDGGWYRAQVTQVQGNSIEVFYIDYGDAATIPLSNVRSMTPEFSSLPAQAVNCCLKGFSSNQGPENFKDLVIEMEFKAQVTGVKSQNSYEVELLSKDGTSIFTSKTLPSEMETAEHTSSVGIIQLKPGDKVDVFIPFVDSAQRFFCQLSQNASNLDDLMVRLEEHYSSDQENLTSISVGSFCVARYEDGGWYRAQVTQAQGNSIEVFYIDYGDTATIPLSSIRSLRPQFSSLPAQAVSCCLKGCSANQEPETFKDLVLEQELKLQVHGSQHPGVYEVELYSEDGSKLFGESLHSETDKGSTLLSEISVGSFVQLCPTACISPQIFYCQIATADHKEMLSQLMDELQEHYEDTGVQEQSIANPTVGMNCAALFPDDGLWYRGRITKVIDGQSVEVFYVDFGNCETVPVSKVKTLKKELSQLASQAIQCSLSSISPASGVEWSGAIVERFSSLTMQKQLVGKVIKKGSEEVLEIELFDTSDQSVDANIGELLVNEGLAIHATTKPVAAIKSFTALKKAKLSESEKVYITAVESPECFFCQIGGCEEKLASLMSEISAVYDSLSSEELAVDAIDVGGVCCAQFSEDNQWYRAVVEECTASELTVRFIDYGNTETLPISRTKILGDAFFVEPPFAIKCSLFGVQPSVGQTWPDGARALIEELTTDLEINAKFLLMTEPLQVELSCNGVDVGEELVKAKLALSTKSSAAAPAVPGEPGSGQYTKPVVQCGEMYDVEISHLSSPGKFYCQLENMKEQLDGMMTDLNDHHFQLAETEGCLVSPTVGQPCVAFYEDSWFRAKVMNISVNDLTVNYVDYGNDETLKPSGVKQMTPSFLKTPEVAIECSLDLNRDEWPEEATALFEKLTTEDEKLIIKILGFEGGRYEVKVFNKKAHCFSEEVLYTIPGAVQERKRTFDQMPLQHDDVKYAWVVHTESPNDFYVQLSETYPQLEEMMAEIAEVYSGLADDLGPDDLVIGHPVCAQFAEDGCWYRAVIQSVPSEFEVEVQYIDYGNSDVILLSDVRQLSRRFFDLPMQAVHCCLDLPGLESFKQRVEDKELKVKFLSSERGKWKVSLYDDDGKIGPSDTTPVVAMPEDSDGIFQIVEFIQPNITQEMKQQLYVSHIVSPDEFYVQFETALDDLTDLSERIGQFYSFLQPSENVLKNPSPGMSCCARFSEDGNWYRGRIKGVTPHGVEVEFVDYGNGEVVNFSEVKDPEKPFMQLPQQAILCGLDATKDQWSSEEINIFKSVALDKSFVAKFIIQDGPKWRVSLESGGTSVVDMFMTKDAVDLQKTNFKNIPGVQSETFAQLQLSSGQIEEVYVSHVTESGDFYVQLSKTSSDLALVENQISEIYDQLGPTTETMEVCFVDSLCCAKYSEDFKWYRACVTKVLSESEVEVHFVDYGNTDCLSVASMKQLRSNLLKFPMQAIKCRLEGSKDIWTESDVEQFEANVSERPLHVTFTRQEETTWFVTIQELDMFSTKAKLTTKEKSFTKEAFDVNKREEAYFLFADSPDCFWLQLVRTGNALEELMGQIASEVSDQPLERSQVKVGLPCLGRYTENDLWHRAQILNVQDDANVTVSYVDYGNQETIPLDRLCPISYSHLKLPAQGIHCRLAEVQGVDPDKITEYLNEELFEKVVEVEVQNQHADGSCTVKLFTPGVSQPLNDQIVGECLGDTSLVEETMLEHASPQKQTVSEERRTFKLPELQSGSKVPVSFISAFLPAEMQLLLTERVEERDQLMEEITSIYQALDENELELEKPEVGMLCCVHFSDKWFRGVIISLSADDTATVKLVDCGTYEKIPISELKLLKDELLQMPVFVVESSLANIQPSSEDGQWSPECSDALESLCRSKALTAEITQVLGDMVELILNDENGKQVNQSLVDLGYAKSCDIQDDFFGEQPGLKWPKLETGQSLDVHLMSVKDLKSIQLQLGDPEACLSTMMDQLSALYSNLGETEEVIGNPRVGQVCCAQFSEDHDWYRAVVTCVSAEGVEVKFVDYGNADIAVMIKQLREEFISLPVQCIDCSLNGVVPAAENSDDEIALKLMELCESKQLKAEVTHVSGDSVAVNLFDGSGETRLSVADSLVKLGLALPQPTQREEPRRVSISEDGKIVYNYPESGDSIHNVSLASTKSPSDFWCELSGSKSELQSLSETIEAFYQSLGENDLRFLCLQVGDTCCAQFTDDNKWCRSQVSEVCSDGQVCVQSVDYVKQETLTINKIKKLEAKFAVLPVQALYCSLHGIEPPHKYYGEDWTSDAVGRFQELCQGEDFKIKIKEQDGSVTLVELIDSADLSIGSQLLSEGLAVEVKSPLTESPVKDLQKQRDNLSAEQENEVDKESSEENVFEDAESGIDGVEKLADVAADEERTKNEEAKEAEDEEEFHDSSDHVREDPSSEDVKEDSVQVLQEAVLEATSEQLVEDEEKKEEEGFKTPVQVQEEVVLEATSEQLIEDEEKKEEGGIKTQIVEEVIDENSKEISSPECEEGLEEVNKEVINEIGKELETSESDKQSQAVFEEVNEEQTEAPVDETLVVSEDVNCPAEEETSKVDNTEKVEGAEEQGEEFVDNTDASVDSGYTGQGVSVEPKMAEDQVTRETSEEKIEGAEEQEEDFVEAQDVLTETFSEEDISAITGSAVEATAAGETAAGVEDRSEEERLKKSNLEEVAGQTSEVEESAKIFLEELVTDVCKSIEEQKEQYKEMTKDSDIEDQTESARAEVQPADIASTDAAFCDDADENVLSDEALDKLDKELEAESTDGKELGDTSTSTVVNGTDDPNVHEVVENGADSVLEETAISSCQDNKLAKANESNEVGSDITVE